MIRHFSSLKSRGSTGNPRSLCFLLLVCDAQWPSWHPAHQQNRRWFTGTTRTRAGFEPASHTVVKALQMSWNSHH